MPKTYKPRGDFVLLRQTTKDKVRGLVMPERAGEGKRIIVVAKGPKVEHLGIGDSVIITGTVAGGEVVRVPEEGDLFMTREACVAIVLEETDDA